VRILLDYRPALVQRTGVGEYAHELAAALMSQLGSEDTLTLFSSSWRDRLEEGRVRGAAVADARVPVYLLNFAWHRLGWPPVETLAGPCDLVHALHPLLIPTRRAAQVVSVHDLYFLDRTEGTAVEVRRDYAALAADHARRADAVIVISKYGAAQAQTRLGVSADRIAICPPGAPPWARRTSSPPDGPIVFIGSSEPRKNVIGLLAAYESLLREMPDAPPLILAGRPPAPESPITKRLDTPQLKGRARHMGYVSDPERRNLYERASMVVVPSLDEGFGMTALEAMTVGAPVVASNRGALPEVVSDAGLLIDPAANGSLAEGMARMLQDRALAERSVEAGWRRSALFTWSASARDLRRAYDDAVERRRQRA
jgi:glycosyltransferase involved in cell wall biosynthesis